jgi:hypothetical protein
MALALQQKKTENHSPYSKNTWRNGFPGLGCHAAGGLRVVT